MDWWELGKSKIRGISIVFCKELLAKRRCMRGMLSNLAQHLKSKVDNGVVLARIRTLFPKLRVSIVRLPRRSKPVPEFSGLKRAEPRQLSIFG